MSALIFGGAGFVGLNLAEHLLAKGQDVTIFDRRTPDAAALTLFKALPGKLTVIAGDVTDGAAIKDAVRPGTDAVFLGAAITAGPEREARDAATILTVNLVAQVPVLEAARDAKVRRVINLSSAAAYGLAGERFKVLDEATPADPVGLYPITKWASERIGARLASLLGLDLVSARLSGVFGPWEHETDVRDTPSPHAQVMRQLLAGEPALLPRAGTRDWTYAVDVAEALACLAASPSLTQPVYNLTAGTAWTVLDWGQMMATLLGKGVCRLATEGEVPNINLYGPSDRAPMSAEALARDAGWRARFGMAAAARHLADWHRAQAVTLGAT